jgi:hypothetical protein
MRSRNPCDPEVIMSMAQLTGNSARGAALRGLLLGLVLQALLIGAIEIVGRPVRSAAAGVFGPSAADSAGLGTYARANR